MYCKRVSLELQVPFNDNSAPPDAWIPLMHEGDGPEKALAGCIGISFTYPLFSITLFVNWWLLAGFLLSSVPEWQLTAAQTCMKMLALPWLVVKVPLKAIEARRTDRAVMVSQVYAGSLFFSRLVKNSVLFTLRASPMLITSKFSLTVYRQSIRRFIASRSSGLEYGLVTKLYWTCLVWFLPRVFWQQKTVMIETQDSISQRLRMLANSLFCVPASASMVDRGQQTHMVVGVLGKCCLPYGCLVC